MNKKNLLLTFTKNRQKFKIPWHESPFPKVDSIVIGELIQYDNDGLHFKILDYQNKEAFMPLKEMSRRKCRNVRSIFKIGDVKPLLVTCVDEITGYIDLSNKYVDMAVDDLDRLEKQIRLINLFYEWILILQNKDSEVFNMEMDQDRWIQVMKNSLWTAPIRDIYDDLIEIKKKNKSILDVFPRFCNIFTNEDIMKFSELIQKHIQYSVQYSMKLTMESRGIQAVYTIQIYCDRMKEKVLEIDPDSKFINHPPYYLMNGKTSYLEKLEYIEKELQDFFLSEISEEIKWKLKLIME